MNKPIISLHKQVIKFLKEQGHIVWDSDVNEWYAFPSWLKKIDEEKYEIQTYHDIPDVVNDFVKYERKIVNVQFIFNKVISKDLHENDLTKFQRYILENYNFPIEKKYYLTISLKMNDTTKCSIGDKVDTWNGFKFKIIEKLPNEIIVKNEEPYPELCYLSLERPIIRIIE